MPRLNQLKPQTLLRGSTAAFYVLALVVTGYAIVSRSQAAGTLNGHTVTNDAGGKLVSWVSPQTDAYDRVINLAWNYLLNSVPNDTSTGQPAYLSQSYLNPDTQGTAGWPSNPAGMNAMLIESALGDYAYSGNQAVITFAQRLADHHLAQGMTKTTDNWANVPYASGDAGSLIYKGAAYGNSTGVGDGTGYLQPDKIGEFGFSLLKLYEQTGNTAYRDAAINAGNALASHVRAGTASQSPWPYRVNAATGAIREQYCADTIGPISLLDELIRLDLGNVTNYQSARTTAWTWLMQYPMQNNDWTQYFEDVAVQSQYNSNLNQYDAMMTARYLLQHPEMDPNWEAHVRELIAWVETEFKVTDNGANVIKEQNAFMFFMGSHTSRYASINALLYEKTGDAAAKEKAYRSFNWSTYMARSNGVVIDGPDVNNQWFTDGYGDYIRHFLTGMGAVPEWAPATQNHLLRSTSTVKSATYSAGAINYTTFDPAATEVLHLTGAPAAVTVGGTPLAQRSDLSAPGWTYSAGALRLYHTSSGVVQITLGGGTVNQPPTATLTAPSSGATYNAPATINLTAGATDTDGTVSKVEFYSGASLLSTDTTAPYSYNWTSVPAGSYGLTAQATDNTGAVATSPVVNVTVTSAADTTPPVISAVSVGSVNQNGATITWTTNEPSDSKVEYGPTAAYGSSTALNATPVTAHTMVVSGLDAGTTYHFRVLSKDAAGNPATGPDATFNTPPAPVAADINADGKVNVFDLSILLAHWGLNEAPCDLNHDGTVNIFDLSQLLSHWTG
jgi:hypothetical protein